MNVLIIDDAEETRNELRDALIQTGNNVIATDDARFTEHLNPHPDIVITDLIMPQSDGLSVVRQLKERNINAKVIFVSVSDRKVLESAERFGKAFGLNVAGVLRKPIDLAAMESLISKEKESGKKSKNTQLGEEEIIALIQKGAIVATFQEQMDLSTGKIMAAESLARLFHAESGQYIYPDQFIETAIRHNLMPLITHEIWRQTVAVCAECVDLGKPLNFSVNMTVNDFDDPDLLNKLRDSLKEEGLMPEAFTIEITETVVYANYLTMLESLTRLRMYGFNLSIDDFGTGYSSLKQLNDLPFNELKIDKEFILNYRKEESRAIVETSIALAKKIGVSVVAEGIETAEILEYLKDLGCNIGQGYFIGRPLLRADFVRKIML